MTGGRKDRGDNDDMDALFAELRDTARQEEAEISSVPSSFASPLSGEERETIAAAMVAALARGNVGTGKAPPLPAPTVESRRRRSRRWLWPIVLLPLAALVLVLRSATGPSFAPLPAYALDVQGGLRDTRGAAPEALAATARVPLQRVSPDTELVIVVRPVVAVDGQVASRAFLIRGDRAEEIAAVEQVSLSGSVETRVRPAGRALGLPGPALLRIVVGRPAAVRAISPGESARCVDGPDARWLMVPLELLGG